MTKKMEIYKCDVCSNVVEVVHEGEGTLVCCNENMKLMSEHMASENNPHYAHIEHIDDVEKKVTFTHCATIEHHIEFIEAISNDGIYIKRKYLKETDKPEMSFKCNCKEGFYIRIYCNIDGVWTTK